MRKQGGKPIICCCFVRDEKPLKPDYDSGGGKPDADWEQGQDFWIKNLSTTSKSGATML